MTIYSFLKWIKVLLVGSIVPVEYKVSVDVENFNSHIAKPQRVAPTSYGQFLKMGFQYNQVLMIGGTSGIGAAMADRLIQEGSKVIVVGRRQDRIDSFVHKHGSDKAGGFQFDLSGLGEIDKFVSTTTQKYPDIDCVFLNAGS